jgi:hypothetical protein
MVAESGERGGRVPSRQLLRRLRDVHQRHCEAAFERSVRGGGAWDVRPLRSLRRFGGAGGAG